ncbi:unnamed protein product [Acanthoscelides obtectus]|uniref:Uncharacterized protein n=1 Tax=Acanthoscelides obtectus TaxID=200917 RepID=A0A9P0JRC5_ACAOB|nr:unnamed protein product [Acanthoscelides obtectus]CAK1671201.1 hypothetical protein AOBTE_LOCUS28138 [Acanthoscelides obtectus]
MPPEERLAVTLRYLATGNSFNSLHFEFLLGVTTFGEIIKDTCQQLWEVMQPLYMSEKSEEDWITISKEFYDRTNFPNCTGAVDEDKDLDLRHRDQDQPTAGSHGNFSSSSNESDLDSDSVPDNVYAVEDDSFDDNAIESDKENSATENHPE